MVVAITGTTHGTLHIASAYDSRVGEAIRRVPNRRWDAESIVWVLLNSRKHADALRSSLWDTGLFRWDGPAHTSAHAAGTACPTIENRVHERIVAL